MKKPKTLFERFDTYCMDNNVELRPWQWAAALSFLSIMQMFDKPASGKTFLITHLITFLRSQG